MKLLLAQFLRHTSKLTSLSHSQSYKNACKIHSTSSLPSRSSFDTRIPLLIGATAVIATQANDSDNPLQDFENWFRREVAPNHRSVNEALVEVMAYTRSRSNAELEILFPSVSRMILGHCSLLLQQERFNEVLKLLDLYWELIRRMDGPFRFPKQTSLALGLETDSHKGLGDREAMKRSKIYFWKLMKQYEWLGEDEWGPRLQSRISYSLAEDFAITGDCDATKFFLHNSVQHARLSSLQSGEEDDNRDQESAFDILDLLSRSLQTYNLMRYVAKSPCSPLFKYAAHDVYDVVYALDPRSVPFWHDLKINAFRIFQSEITRAAKDMEALEADGLRPESIMDVVSNYSDAGKISEEDALFMPTSLLMQPNSTTL